MKTIKSPKGNDLVLTNLKGKDYMMVAYRLIWFVEANERFEITTHVVEAMSKPDEYGTVKTTVKIFDNDGKFMKGSEATKTEHKKDFNDFLEKAETGSLGRALAMLGYGTQFALNDLDEGERIVDSPVVDTKAAKKEEAKVIATSLVTVTAAENKPATPAENKPASSFNKSKFKPKAEAKKEEPKKQEETPEDNGWS